MEELDGLSPEELAAMEEDTQDEDVLAGIAGEEDGEAEGSDADDSGEDAGSDLPEAAAVAAEVQEPIVPVQPADVRPVVDMSEAPVVPMFIPEFSAELRPDLQQRLDAAREQFESGEGEMDLAGYERIQREVTAANMQWQTQSAKWAAEQDAFLSKFDEYGAPGPLRDALNGEITRLDSTTEGRGLSGMQLLMLAKARVEQALGVVREPAAQPMQNAKAGGQRPAAARPNPATHALGTMPAAAPAEVGGGEFKHLDTLSGLELERAVAALTPDQRDRWAAEA